MSLKYQRPNSSYTGNSALSNREKYQSDATAEPKIAISSSKVDGDFNYVVDALNEIDQASGTRASIDDRLSVSVNADGTLKASVVAALDDWIPVNNANPVKVNNTTIQVDGDVTELLTGGQRVRLSVNSFNVFANVVSSQYGGSTTQIILCDIVDANGSSTVISQDPGSVAYAFLAVGTTGNSQFQFNTLKMRDSAPVFRLKKDGGDEFGLSIGTGTLDFVENTGTEESPSWTVHGQVSSSGLVVGNSTVTLAKLADGTADKYLGFDGSGNPAELDAPAIVTAGCLLPYAGAVVPNGWLLCDGAEVSRTTYSALFAAIGTAYGNGDGSTTFNLPDMRGRTIFGLDNMGGTSANRLTGVTTLGDTGGNESKSGSTDGHTLTESEMPSHTHGLTIQGDEQVHSSGTGSSVAGSQAQILSNTTANREMTASVGGDTAHSHTITNFDVINPYTAMNWVIKS
ncbi:MAG: tail fiber protein [Alphaproteobacteria bacterium]|nr:tail fiber protein [Alphaproteobacteria bacterium]MDD9919825.1 tail fiber protein [Alphaproteobacteria bacterium]